MPVCFQIAPDLDLKLFSFLFKTWNKCASGQIVTFSGCFHSKKYSTGGFSSMEIFFWFPLSIVLSAQSLFNIKTGGVMQVFPECIYDTTSSRRFWGKRLRGTHIFTVELSQ